MVKRARYDGPHESVVVHWPPGETNPGAEGYQTWEVKREGWLSADAPAALRDELTARGDWSEVDQKSAPKNEKED